MTAFSKLRIISVMTRVTIVGDRLEVRFTRAEKLAGLLRDVDIPLGAVRAVAVELDGLSAARGVRAPGLGLPGLRKIGTWRSPQGKSVVVARKGRPALRLTLAGLAYDELLLDVPDPEGMAGQLQHTT